jgi:hypothetical protein
VSPLNKRRDEFYFDESEIFFDPSRIDNLAVDETRKIENTIASKSLKQDTEIKHKINTDKENLILINDKAEEEADIFFRIFYQVEQLEEGGDGEYKNDIERINKRMADGVNFTEYNWTCLDYSECLDNNTLQQINDFLLFKL